MYWYLFILDYLKSKYIFLIATLEIYVFTNTVEEPKSTQLGSRPSADFKISDHSRKITPFYPPHIKEIYD